MSAAAKPRIVFLDRDGTINVKAPEGAYITRPGDLELLPGAGAALARLNRAGYRVALVTNQRGIALGRMTQADYEDVHSRLEALLAEQGARLDAAYYCPHDRRECFCRKPHIGMLTAAADEAGIDSPADCVMVGDAPSDIAAGKRFGARTIQIGTAQASGDDDTDPDRTAPTLQAAVDLLLAGDL